MQYQSGVKVTYYYGPMVMHTFTMCVVVLNKIKHTLYNRFRQNN